MAVTSLRRNKRDQCGGDRAADHPDSRSATKIEEASLDREQKLSAAACSHDARASGIARSRVDDDGNRLCGQRNREQRHLGRVPADEGEAEKQDDRDQADGAARQQGVALSRGAARFYVTWIEPIEHCRSHT
jgi:hypothetical protein